MKGYLKNGLQVAFHVTGMQGVHTASDYLANNRVRELTHAPYVGIGSFMRATACFPKDKLVTKRIKLQDIVSEGFEALVKEKSQVKILVSPN